MPSPAGPGTGKTPVAVTASSPCTVKGARLRPDGIDTVIELTPAVMPVSDSLHTSGVALLTTKLPLAAGEVTRTYSSCRPEPSVSRPLMLVTTLATPTYRKAVVIRTYP